MHRVLVLGLMAFLSGCGGSPLCCGWFVSIVDRESGEPVSGVEIEWVAVDDPDINDDELDDLFDRSGRKIGSTDEGGGILVPICGRSFIRDFVNADFVPNHNLTLLRIDLPTDAEFARFQLEIDRPQNLSSLGFPSTETASLDLSVTGLLCQSDRSVDELIPDQQRTGKSRGTFLFVHRPEGAPLPTPEDEYYPNEFPGEPLSRTSVEFATSTDTGLEGLTPEQYLDQYGQTIGRTDECGYFDLLVDTVVPPFVQCESGYVDRVWLMRIAYDGVPKTIVLSPSPMESETRFYDFTGLAVESEDRTVTLYSPYADCLCEFGCGGPIEARRCD